MLAIGWTLLIATLTLLPGSTIDRFNLWGILSFDKVGHWGLYFILSFLTVNYLSTLKKYNNLVNSLITILIVTSLGIALELLQGMIPGRNFDFVDMIFNIAGTITGLIVYKIFTNFSQVI